MSDALPDIRAQDCFFAADIVVGDSSEESKSAPVELVARSGDAIEHHIWGRVVHDFDGMQHKSKIALDYNHNPDEVVGYANKFDHSKGDLHLSGALTPFKESDRGTEILSKSRQGVPYEASINFAGPMAVERLKKNETATVNGRNFSGPLTIIRKWHLRGVAICPYGYDHQTQAVALSQSDRDISVIVMEKSEMSTDTKLSDTQENTAAVEEQSVDTAAVTNSSEAVTQTAVDEQAELTQTGADRPVGDYWAAFGEAEGSVYFAKGIPFQLALAEDNKGLRDRLKNAEAKLAQQATDGHEDAVSFSIEEAEPPEEGKDKDGKLTAIPIKIQE